MCNRTIGGRRVLSIVNSVGTQTDHTDPTTTNSAANVVTPATTSSDHMRLPHRPVTDDVPQQGMVNATSPFSWQAWRAGLDNTNSTQIQGPMIPAGSEPQPDPHMIGRWHIN